MSTSNDGSDPIIEDDVAGARLQRPALTRDFGQAPRQPGGEPFVEQTPIGPAEVLTGPPPTLRPLQRKVGVLERWKGRGGLLGTIASVLIFLVKVFGPALFFLGKVKFLLLMAGSMLLSIWLESKVFGWQLAVGIVMLIFIHECGHALAARIRGIPTGMMVFIPFLGAFVTTKRYGRNLVEDAFIGIAGPVVGSVAAAACAGVYLIDHDRFWLVLAQWGFFINLFNLLPTPPLDGGWIAPLFSPKLLAIGAVLAVIAGFRNPLIWVLLFASGPRIIAGWKADPKTQPYYQVPIAAKWGFGGVYVGLAILLALASSVTGGFLVA